MASDSPSLDLSHLPLTFLLPTHLSSSQALHSEAQLRSCKCPLAPSISTASLFLADINTPKRAAFELRGRGLKTAYLSSSSSEPPIRVVKLAWFNLSLSAGKLLPIEEYTVYTAVRTAVVPSIEPKTLQSKKATADEELRKEILERARRDAVRNREEDKRHGNDYLRFERHGKDELVDLSMRQRRGIGEIMELSGAGEVGHRRSGTPEFEDKRQARTAEDMPEWVKKNGKYSCCRPTLSHSPNALFIRHLHTIRLSRALSSSSIGMQAYSTMIAVLQAYPYTLCSPFEVSLLPGCDVKASSLFAEWLHSNPDPEKRSIQAVRDLEDSKSFRTLRMLSSIYGVGTTGAREWYYDEGWRTLDDVVEFGWSALTRTQQIGVKYYEEFQQKMLRSEAERIGEIIGHHAAKLRPGMKYTLAGGYRRGKNAVDSVVILVSHTDDAQVQPGFIHELVTLLDSEDWVTHTLHLGRELETQDREDRASDSLEKARVVWREVKYANITAKTPLKERNENPHRRVDIVLVPPRSVGTALLHWTGGATFMRDLKLWCEKEKGWVLTSDGVVEVVGGEKARGVDATWRCGETMQDAEKRVFEGLGLQWVGPEERCTG